MTTQQQTDHDALREQVRTRYAAAATKVTTGQGGCGCGQPAECGCDDSCCGTAATAEEPGFGAELYAALERDQLPDTALLASLGCGNPTAVAELHQGETVLDLGSGGGIDVLLSAKRVGPSGRVYGLDMTEEMLALARSNASEAGASNVDFLKGQIEAIPLPAETVDVVISNCVVNLSTDKPAVFAETFRVLKPGGRLGITDVVAEDHLSPEDRAERGSYVGCIAGALSKAEYEAGLAAAGFEQVSVAFTHQVGDGLHSAIIKATKPTTTGHPSAFSQARARATLPLASQPGCC
jgi:arsenite methyltransferase